MDIRRVVWFGQLLTKGLNLKVIFDIVVPLKLQCQYKE